MYKDSRFSFLRLGICFVFSLFCVHVFTACALPVGDYRGKSVDADSSVVLYEDITVYDLQRYVPVPVKAMIPKPPVSDPNLDFKNMTINVEWLDEAGTKLPPGFEFFDAETTYRAKITLSAKEDFSFRTGISFRYYTKSDSVDKQPAVNTNPVLRVCEVTYCRTR
jgi:hypothetical protein